MEPIIRFESVTMGYPGEPRPALRQISFTVQQGEFLCLIGPSGCGKTTILKIIAGLALPGGGRVKKPENISMAFQSGALLPWLSVYENVALGLRQKGTPAEELRRIVDRELRAMHLTPFHDKYPADLSGGQRQRVGIARALAVEPSVLLLDEPFSALDPKTTVELHDDLITLWREKKITIVMVSHLIEEAVALADRVMLMREGSIKAQFPITLPFPRREQGAEFMMDVQKIRHAFFAE